MAGYAKLFSTITESSLWSEPKEVRLLFVSMLAKADAIGFVEAAIPGLARAANLTVAEIESSLAVLEAPDPHSKNPAFDGRRIEKVPGGWILLNYAAYRGRGGAKGGDEDRRSYMRDYMRDYRAKHRSEDGQSVSNVSDCKQVVNTSVRQAEAEAEAEADTSLGVPNDVVCAWNRASGTVPVRKLTAARKKALNARLKDSSWDWQAALSKFPLKCFSEHGGWKPNFDWFIRPDTVTSILEGKYDWSKKNGKQDSGRVGPGQRYRGE